MFQLQNNSAGHLISAYNLMIGEMKKAFEQSKAGDMSLQESLKLARRQVVRIGAASVEEAFQISEYIKRDINDAAEYMMETSAEFYDWLLLDIETVEHKVMDIFLSVADNTRIELEQFTDDRSGRSFWSVDSSDSPH